MKNLDLLITFFGIQIISFLADLNPVLEFIGILIGFAVAFTIIWLNITKRKLMKTDEARKVREEERQEALFQKQMKK